MTLTGSGSVSLSPGDVASVPSGQTFDGGLNTYPAGAFVCVQPGGTFAPAWMNNPAGTLSNLGTVTNGSFVLAAGFLFDNEGTTTLGALNVNGSATITNAAGAEFTVSSSFAPSSGTVIDNDGTFRVQGNFNFNTGTILQNNGTVDVTSAVTVDGVVENRGVVSAAGMNVNGGSNVFNGCQLTLSGDFNNNATAFTNSGLVQTTGAMTNNNNYTQTATGQTTGVNFTNNGSVTGFGEFLFQGNTVTQNSFVGTSENDPIVFDDRTPTSGRIFDVQSGQVVNVVAGSVSVPGPTSPDCAGGENVPSADVATSKTGPETVDPGGSVAYSISVTNYGPDPAQDVVVTDHLPPELGSPDAVGGTVANGQAVWTVGTVAVGSTLTFDLTGRAPSSGSFTDVVSSTSSTPDPDPTNNDGTSASASVRTIVTEQPPEPVPPVVDDLTVFTVARVPVSDAVLASEPEGVRVMFSLLQGPSNGSVALLPSGEFTYTPTDDFVGIDTFRTTGCIEDTTLCDSNTVTVTVYPIAREVASSTEVDTPVDIDVGTEVIGTPTDVSVLQQPTNGTASLQSGSVITYTPNASFAGDDVFAYEACATDAPTLCASAIVTVQVVEPPRVPPDLEDQSWTTTANHPVWGEITPAESDPDLTVTITVQSPPLDGSVAQSGNVFTYTPDHEFTGVDSFVVKGCDDGAPSLCDQATITVTVLPGPEPDSAVTTAGTPVTIDVKANDAGAATTGPPTTTTQPQNGTAQPTGTGSYLYTPNTGFEGTDAFGYQICSLAAPALCGSTTVTVDVAPAPPPNEPPVVEDLTVQTSAGLPVDGTTSRDRSRGRSAYLHGDDRPGARHRATGGGRQLRRTRPTGNTFAGIDTFVVSACDPSDACDSGTVTVRILPIAQPISLITEALASTGVDVFAHVNGTVDPPTITQPANGTATIISAGNVEYLPTGSFTGQDSFDYTVCASGIPVGTEPLCDQSVIRVDVYPIAIDSMMATTPNHPVTVNLAVNDPGDALDATLLGAPTHGQLTNLGGNQVTYTPDGVWTGVEEVGYQRCSAGAVPLCAQAPVVITTVPLLHNDGAITHQGQPVTVDVSSNDEGEAGRPSVVAGPAAGRATVVGVGDITYTPNAKFTGIDTLIYLRCSPNAPSLCATATLAVLVVPAPALTASTPPPKTEAKLELAVTGTDLRPLASLALALMVLGLALVFAASTLFGVKRRARHRIGGGARGTATS